jgi:hypothetical protein
MQRHTLDESATVRNGDRAPGASHTQRWRSRIYAPAYPPGTYVVDFR